MFTDDGDGSPGRLVGLAEPTAIRSALERRYAWLYPAFVRATLSLPNESVFQRAAEAHRSEIEAKQRLDALVRERDSALPDQEDALLVRERAQRDNWYAASSTRSAAERDVCAAVMIAGAAHSPDYPAALESFLIDEEVRRTLRAGSTVEPGWVRLDDDSAGSMRVEHAEWVDRQLITRILGLALRRDAVVRTPGITDTDLYRQAVLTDAPFVAMVDRDDRFVRLLERAPVLDHVARAAVEAELA